MKLFKGILAIAIVSLLFVSCKEAKKGADAVKDGVEATADAAKGAVDATKDAASKTADAVKGAAGDVKDAVTGKKCGADCKKACCAKKAHVCDATCKEKGCTAHKADHKCSDAKCSADCKDANCVKCKAKQAECKVKCAAKKAEGTVKKGTDAVKDAAHKH